MSWHLQLCHRANVTEVCYGHCCYRWLQITMFSSTFRLRITVLVNCRRQKKKIGGSVKHTWLIQHWQLVLCTQLCKTQSVLKMNRKKSKEINKIQFYVLLLHKLDSFQCHVKQKKIACNIPVLMPPPDLILASKFGRPDSCALCPSLQTQLCVFLKIVKWLSRYTSGFIQVYDQAFS